jgi:hypothetical protein
VESELEFLKALASAFISKGWPNLVPIAEPFSVGRAPLPSDAGVRVWKKRTPC